MLLKYPSNSPIVYVSANTHPLLQQAAAVITVSANHIFAVNRWSSQNANIPLANRTLNNSYKYALTLCIARHFTGLLFFHSVNLQ